jgi:hypothetical protein
MNNLVRQFIGLIVLALLAAGCGSGGPRLYKAGGTVTYNGKPVEGATLLFVYENGNSASGLSDAAGKFDLVYQGKTGGTAAGKCKVLVTKMSGGSATTTSAAPKMDPSKMTDAEKTKFMEDAKAKMSGAATTTTAAKNELPAKYANPEGSGLSFEVLPKNDNNFVIELKD